MQPRKAWQGRQSLGQLQESCAPRQQELAELTLPERGEWLARLQVARLAAWSQLEAPGLYPLTEAGRQFISKNNYIPVQQAGFIHEESHMKQTIRFSKKQKKFV